MMPIQMASRSFSPNHFDKRTSKTAAMAILITWPNGALVLTVACLLVSRFTHLVRVIAGTVLGLSNLASDRFLFAGIAYAGVT
jgi:hypothetical protein